MLVARAYWQKIASFIDRGAMEVRVRLDQTRKGHWRSIEARAHKVGAPAPAQVLDADLPDTQFFHWLGLHRRRQAVRIVRRARVWFAKSPFASIT